MIVKAVRLNPSKAHVEGSGTEPPLKARTPVEVSKAILFVPSNPVHVVPEKDSAIALVDESP